MITNEFKIIKGRMKLTAKSTFKNIIIFPVPEFATYNLVAFRASYADKPFVSLAPCHAIEVPRPSTDVADKPPVPVASWEIAVDVLRSSTTRVTFVRVVD